MANQAEIDRLTHYLPLLVCSDISDKSRKFVASQIARSRRGPITLTEPQLRWLRSLVDHFQAAHMRDSNEIIDGNDTVER
jgi:hypothetical protein